MALQFLSTVSRFPAGLAGSTTVTPQITNGVGPPTNDGSAVVGSVSETNTPGTYTCLLTYPNADVALPYVPWAHWNVNGSLIDDYAPLALYPDTVFIQGPFKLGQASQIDFYMVLSTDHVSPATGKVPTMTAQRSIAGAAFTAVTGTVAEIGSGAYRLSASAADMTGTDMLFLFTSGGADPVIIPVNTTP